MSDNYVLGYFDWLCDIINLNPSTYDILIYELYKIEFDWKLPLDSDRNYDGLILRDEYYNGIDISDFNDQHCSVLEVLITLSRKMDYILDDEDRGDRTRIWFWEFLDNLGLLKYSNTYLEEPYGRNLNYLNRIHEIIDIWLNRSFDYTGRGSPFPLDQPLEDQRNLDMIRQLNAYILEKHMYEDELL